MSNFRKIILFTTLCATTSFANSPESSWLMFKPAELTSLIDNKTYKLESDNRLTIIYFLASWCDICHTFTQMVQYLDQKYSKAGLRTILIYLHEPAKEATQHLENTIFGKEIFLGNDQIIADFYNPIAPTIFLIDRKGYLTGRYSQASELSTLTQLITLHMSI